MKRLVFLFLLMIGVAFALSPLFGQDPDLSGTWVGTTFVPDSGDDQVTLVLKKEGETYSGTVSDSMGMAVDSKLENGKFADGTLTADFTIFNGSDYMKIKFTLKPSGELLVGNWESAEGETGNLELKRKN